MNDYSKEQEQYFNEWNLTCDSLKFLNGIVQNDLKQLIDSKYTTKDELKNNLIQFNDEFLNNIKKLSQLQKDINTLCNNIIND